MSESSGLRLTGRRVSLKDVAYRSLRDAIVDLQLAPGETVTEERLASELGVSRSILREALQRLQTEGLLDRLSNGRLRVTPTSLEEVHHLYVVRTAIARVAVDEAVPRVTAADVDRLREAIAIFRRDSEQGDIPTLVRSGTRFHDLIFEIAANPVNTAVMAVIQPRIDRYRHISVASTHQRPGRSLAELERVSAALAERDAPAAGDAMAAHIAASEQAVVAALSGAPAPASDQRVS
jgi:DNA-binding GntR family transcriptional regulator